MTKANYFLMEALNMVKHKIQWEGFDYCFRHYSDWDEVKDPEFHRLKKGYLLGEIRDSELQNYISVKLASLEKLKD